MSGGGFKQPPKGPEIGPTHNLKDLPEEKRAEVGDMKSTVFKAAEEAPQQSMEQAAEDVTKVTDGGPLAERLEGQKIFEGQQAVEALDAVLQREAEEDAADLRDEAMPTDEDKQNFLRSVLGNKRYTKTYELFGGAIGVTMVELTPAEEDTVFSVLAGAQAEKKIVTEDDWTLGFERLRMAYSVTNIRYGSGLEADIYKRNPDSADNIPWDGIERYVKQFKGATVFRAVMQASRLFRTQLEIMLEASLSPDFWTVGGPDSQSPPTQEVPSTTAVSPSPDRGDSAST